MNLLAASNQAMSEIGLPTQSSLIGNQSTDAIQILAICQAAGQSLLKEFDWEQLETQYTWNVLSQVIQGTTTIGSTAISLASTPAPVLDTTYQIVGTGIPQDVYVVSNSGTSVIMSQPATSTGTVTLTFGKTKYPFPADYDRMIDRTAYDKSRRWAMVGPATPQEWEWLKSSYISTGPRIRYRFWGGFIQTWPIIATSDLLSFEYVSNGYAVDATTLANKSSFTADTDNYIWPDRLFITAVKSRYMSQRGLDSGRADGEYMQQLSLAKAMNKGADNLTMTNQRSTLLINISNIPDSGYGL
jgi:hypothetical protein